jgi:hypothetical protein
MLAPAPLAYPDVEGGATSSRAVFPAAIFSMETLIQGQDRGQGPDLLVN